MKRITEASKAIGVSPSTLRRWTRMGLVPVVKTPRGRWFWTSEMLERIRQDMQCEAEAAAGSEA